MLIIIMGKMEKEVGRKRRKRTGGRGKIDYSNMKEYGRRWKKLKKKEGK
jgi:hypothetical protein